MKVIAILSVDEDVLNEVKEGDETTKVVSEFAWLHDSGIILDECHDLENSDIDNVTDEYQLLIWNKEKEEYSPVGQCQKTLEQCKQLAEVYLSIANQDTLTKYLYYFTDDEIKIRWWKVDDECDY